MKSWVIKILFQPMTAFVVFVLAMIFFWSLHARGQRVTESERILEESRLITDQLQEQVDDLEKSLEEAQAPFVQEKIIRDQLLLQKPGEYVVQLPTELVSPEPSQLDNQAEATPLEKWKRVLGWDWW